jgi:CheY-specific phosphatase CheX
MNATAADAERIETLGAVCAQVLETMFFTEAAPVECRHGWPALSARVRFTGSHTGEMLLAISEGAAEPLASAFLGLDPDATGEGERGQVASELANILCGAVLSNLWPESSLLLETPELAGPECVLEHAVHHCFEMPEGLLAVSLRVEETAQVS